MEALLVEPREHLALSFVLLNFFEGLPGWSFVLFHGANKGYLDAIMSGPSHSMYAPRVRYVDLGVSNLTISEYNSLLKSWWFYEQVRAETFLLFQTDSMILQPALLGEFLEYDYVGAPWQGSYGLSNGEVGNGGLSLRRKSKMLEVLRSPSQHEYEDVFFSCSIPLHKPTAAQARRFSVETVFSLDSFGVHKAWAWLSAPELELLQDKYPGLRTLISLQKN